jgi:hypothetical protein
MKAEQVLRNVEKISSDLRPHHHHYHYHVLQLTALLSRVGQGYGS